MLLNLHEVQSNKPLRRELELSDMVVEAVSGPVTVTELKAVFQFRLDPLGFAVHYTIGARTSMACIRCSETVDREVTADDWISLRTQQPEGSHLVLNDSEMNVRFIQESRLDLTALTTEIVELAVPVYPRHDEDHPSCLDYDEEQTESKASPFSVLSKYLES